MIDLTKVKTALKKQYGSLKIGNELQDEFQYVSTGNFAFDLASSGGVPFGHCTEFLGLTASGKSLLIQKVIANAHKNYDAVALLADRENAYSKARGEQLKINNEKLIIAHPWDIPLARDAFTFLIDGIVNIRKQDAESKTKEKTYVVMAIDSIAAFDQDVALDKGNVPRKTKELHAGFRKILPYIDERTMLVFANQVTYKIGVVFGDPRTSTGGEASKYYSTVRFALEEKKKIIDDKRGNEVIGNWLGVEIIKTRLGPCHRVINLKHLYKTGIDYYSGYARLLAKRNYLIPKNKKEFNSFKQSTLLYGEEEVNENTIDKFVEKHPELKFDKFPEWKEEKI